MVQNILEDIDYDTGYGNPIQCPCGFNYVHYKKTVDWSHWRMTEEGREEDGQMAIHFWCESGHTFSLVLREHEGMTYVSHGPEVGVNLPIGEFTQRLSIE
jgi:hypothetical protein